MIRLLVLSSFLSFLSIGGGSHSQMPLTIEQYENVLAELRAEKTSLEAQYQQLKEHLAAAADVVPQVCNGRLTLESGVAVSTSNQSAKTTVYFTPFNGHFCALYTGSVWRLYRFAELSISLGTLANNTNYDVFMYNNSGVAALELSSAWSGNNTRNDTLTTLNGVYVKNSNNTRRYLGTFRTVSTTTTEDTDTKRYLWNNYNRRTKLLLKTEGTDSWTNGNLAFGSLNASNTNRVEAIVGLSEGLIVAETKCESSSGGGTRDVGTGVGFNSTGTNNSQFSGAGSGVDIATRGRSYYMTYASSPGYFYLQALDYGNGTETIYWYGDKGSTNLNCGIRGEIEN